jgi:GlpG protein
MKKGKLRITMNAPVVFGMVAISFVATLLNYLTAGGSGKLIFMTYHSSLLSPLTWVRAFTYIFGHADCEQC